MRLSRARLFALVLVSLESVVICYPVSVDDSSTTDALENEYLRYLFQTIEDSGRQPNSLGEINLLPEDTKRFANMVQCIAEDPTVETKEPTDALPTHSHRRTLNFNLMHNFISRTQKLVAFRLVIRPPQNHPIYKVNVYETTGPESPEDSGMSREKWIDLHVALFDQPNRFPAEENIIYQLVLEVESPDKSIDDHTLNDILKSLKPVLVVYSYDIDLLKNLFQTPKMDAKSVSKRSISGGDAVSESIPTTTSLEEKRKEFCQVHSVNLTTFDHFDTDMFEIIYPLHNTQTFCYGHCRIQGRDDENANRVSMHAKFVGYSNPSLVEAGVIPCCVPTSFGVSEIKFRSRSSSHGSVLMTLVDHVESCSCY